MNLFTFILLISISIQSKMILFDQAHSQIGSNYDFIVDDDSPIPLPYPPSGPNSWNGQLSTWAFELYTDGHSIRINTDMITPVTLSGVDLLVIPEPQDTFSLSEMDAIEDFVLNGGSLFIIADHNSSDRNHSNWDSPSIFDGFLQPHITTPPGSDTSRFIKPRFGLYLHVKDDGNNSITGTWTNVSSNPQDPVIHGRFGEVDSFTYHVGNVFTLYPHYKVNFDSITGHIWKNSSPQGTTLVIVATAKIGSGKVAGIGDSSPFCDGSGPTTHENNWTETDNREVIMNTSAWLLNDDTAVEENPEDIYKNIIISSYPIKFILPFSSIERLKLYDLSGRLIDEIQPCRNSENSTEFVISTNLESSIYFFTINKHLTYKLIIID